MLRRHSRTDRWLLGLLVPVSLLLIALQAREVAIAGLAQPTVFAVPSHDGSGYPVVGGLRLETGEHWAGLEPGDRLLRVGDVDLEGVGYLGFTVIALEEAGASRSTQVVYERDGVPRRAELRMRPLPGGWSRVLVILLFVTTGTWILWRSPGSRDARLLFLGFMSTALLVFRLESSTAWVTWIHQVVFNLGGTLAPTLVLRWLIAFPPELAEEKRVRPAWCLVGLLFPVARFGYWFGGPVPPEVVPQIVLATDLLMFGTGVSIVISNYRNAQPIGRRRLRWISAALVACGSAGVAMGLAGALGADDVPIGVSEMVVFATISSVSVPVALLFSVLRYDLFDIDRLFSATATYSVAVLGFVGLALVLASVASPVVSAALGVAPQTAQSIILLGVVAFAVPAGSRLRPRIERLLFPALAQVEREIEQLMRDLPSCRSEREVLALAGRIPDAMRCECIGVFTRRDGAFIARPAETDATFGAADELVRALERDPVPIDLASRTAQQLGAAERDRLTRLRARVCVPIRQGAEMHSFLLLGEKRSGDVFTNTDLASLRAASAAASAELLRLRDAGAIDAERSRADEMDRLRVEAQDAIRARSSLLAAVSHDLRQPLHSLGLLEETLSRQLGENAARETLAKMEQATDSMGSMIASLLDLSRLEAGTLEPSVGELRLDDLFRGLEAEFAEVAARKGVELEIEPCGATTRSDLVLLGRILRNLVGNALRYTEQGAVRVRGERVGEEIEIRVSDTGPGIPEEDRERIFGAFTRLESGGEGLGLGLSIVRGLAGLLGHPLSLRSTVGRGSEFTLRAPCMRATPGPAPGSTSATGSLEGKLVLVVDDDLSVLDAMRDLLEGWGCTVVVCSTTDDACASLARIRRTPDMIVSDYQLADGEDGLGAIARIRSTTQCDVPAIVLTAESTKATLDAIRARGLPVLGKPVRPARLRAALTELTAPR